MPVGLKLSHTGSIRAGLYRKIRLKIHVRKLKEFAGQVPGNKCENLVFDDRLVFCASGFRSRHTVNCITPYDTSLSRACFSTSWNIMITYTLNTLVFIYVVDLFTRWVIILIYNCFYRTFVNTSCTVDTSIM